MTFTIFRRIFNLMRDIVFQYLFLKRIKSKDSSGLEKIIGNLFFLAMLFMYSAEDGGIFTNAVFRFFYRVICLCIYLASTKEMNWKAAVYDSVVCAISITLAHNLFLTPLTRPLLLGTSRTIAGFFLSNIITILIYILIYYAIPIQEVQDVNKERTASAVLASIVCIYLNASLRTVTDANTSVIISYSVFSILLQIALLLNIIFIEQILHNTRLQMNQEIALRAARNKIDAIHHQEENDQKLREVRHDIRNHLNSISYLISDGHIKEAQKYIQQLMGDYALAEKTIHTGNIIIDGLITEKLNVIQKEHIELQLIADFSSLSSIEEMDLCTIFGNALDNAIEACEKVPDEKERFIEMRSMVKTGFTVITVRNGLHDEVKDLGTSKKDRSLHGYGIRNMKKAVEKNNGSLSIDINNTQHIFRLTIILPLANRANG